VENLNNLASIKTSKSFSHQIQVGE
jgi:hypothetical protein